MIPTVPADRTVLRPAGPPAGPYPVTPMNPAPGGDQPSPRRGIETPLDGGTVLRPASRATPEVAQPLTDPWGATSLTPPPPGAWTPPPMPGYDPTASPDHTMVGPHIRVPAVNPGDATLESRFAPPAERPGIPDLEPPRERFAPVPIPGGPTDLPRGGRFAAPEDLTNPEPPQRRPFRLPRWVAGLAVLLVLGLVGAGIWWRFRPVVIDGAITAPTSAAPVNKPKVGKPEDAVRGYLTALKDGDINRALSYGPVGPGSRVLLTDAALKDAQTRAPIGNIDVPAVTSNTSSIRARFTIGTEAVDRTFNVTKTDDGGWQLAKTTTTVQLSAKRSTRVPLLVNKQAIENVAVLELVPGVYHFETGLPFLRYAASTDIKVQSLDYNEPINVLNLELTEAGRAALLEQGQLSMKACLEQPTLNPPNCPFGFVAPQPVTNIRWTQTKDPWPGVQLTLTKEDPAVAEANFTISLNAAVEYANGSKSDRNPYEGEVRLTADITKQRPQDIQVKWSEARR